jgi:hypothetical protein
VVFKTKLQRALLTAFGAVLIVVSFLGSSCLCAYASAQDGWFFSWLDFVSFMASFGLSASGILYVYVFLPWINEGE